MITLFEISQNNFPKKEKEIFKNINYTDAEKIDKKNIKKKIQRSIMINGKKTKVTFITTKDNNQLILHPKKIKQEEKK